MKFQKSPKPLVISLWGLGIVYDVMAFVVGAPATILWILWLPLAATAAALWILRYRQRNRGA